MDFDFEEKWKKSVEHILSNKIAESNFSEKNITFFVIFSAHFVFMHELFIT